MWKILRPDAAAVLKDEKAQASLARYFAVMQNRKPAKSMIARRIPAQFSENDSAEQLWHEHRRLTETFHEIEEKIDADQEDLENLAFSPKSYLHLKAEIASRILQRCHLCTRKCGINRVEGERGYCKCGPEMEVSSIFEHMGEEPELVPSGTVFTMGCTMRCKHCQNWTISQWFETGQVYEPKALAKELEHLRRNGCRNANLVGGEPTPWLLQWLETFKHVDMNIPVVWNSNSYYSPETAQLLEGFIDVYLLDFKYGPAVCAERISEAPEYWAACTHNHLTAKKCGELIIRLLVLPSHLECCLRPIMKWIVENLGAGTRVNVMFQYRPEWRAHEIPELRRGLDRDEILMAAQLAKETGLTNFIT
jgi:putative pyruvate formate lyase activating enzyme